MSIEPQTVVRRADGMLGVVTPDLPAYLNDNGPGDVTVFWFDGSDGTESRVPVSSVSTIGPEGASASLRNCGAGLGEFACRYLIMIGPEPTCMRFGTLRWPLVFRSDMRAKRDPKEAYPDCKLSDDQVTKLVLGLSRGFVGEVPVDETKSLADDAGTIKTKENDMSNYETDDAKTKGTQGGEGEDNQNDATSGAEPTDTNTGNGDDQQ